mmetsp:Transcript_104537/g.292913  ORF Transcript_104537/g.292913 Transcript_104537/m.292913 type:complete len:308 (+) Transcript_104537:253-1176(+)
MRAPRNHPKHAVERRRSHANDEAAVEGGAPRRRARAARCATEGGRALLGRTRGLRELLLREPPALEALLHIPTVVLPWAVAPIPEEPPVRGLRVRRQLRPGEQRPHLVLRNFARLRAAAEGETPLADDDGELPQLLDVRLHCSQVLREGQAMPVVLEAVVPVDLEACVGMVAAVQERLPPLGETSQRALEDRQHDTDLIRSHASVPYRSNRPVVKAAQDVGRHLRRRLVAHGEARDAAPVAVALRDAPYHPQRLADAPLPPVPRAARRALPAAARRLATLAPRAAMEVEEDLKAAVLGPLHGAVQER